VTTVSQCNPDGEGKSSFYEADKQQKFHAAAIGTQREFHII
jgi:hypothetical protein